MALSQPIFVASERKWGLLHEDYLAVLDVFDLFHLPLLFEDDVGHFGGIGYGHLAILIDVAT